VLGQGLAADLDARAVHGRGVQGELTTGPLDQYREALSRVVTHDADQLVIAGDRDAVDGDDLVADFQSGELRGVLLVSLPFRESATPTWLVEGSPTKVSAAQASSNAITTCMSDPADANRAFRGYDADRYVRFSSSRESFRSSHARDLHVTAGKNRANAVARFADGRRPDDRPEADEEISDLHPRALGRDEVTELVGHHDEDDREDHERQRPADPPREQRHEGDGAGEKDDQGPTGLGVRIHDYWLRIPWARARAVASLATRSAKESNGSAT